MSDDALYLIVFAIPLVLRACLHFRLFVRIRRVAFFYSVGAITSLTLVVAIFRGDLSAVRGGLAGLCWCVLIFIPESLALRRRQARDQPETTHEHK